MGLSFSRPWTLAWVFLAAFLALPLAARAQVRVVKVGLFPAAPLVGERKGKPEGLFVDVLEEVARERHWQLSYVQGTWPSLLAQLESGTLDLLPAVGYTAERTAVYDFSKNPVFIDSGVIFTKPNRVPRTIFDLAGQRVAAVAGSLFTKGFQDYVASFGISCQLVLVKDNPEVMRRIASGEVDAGVCIYSLGTSLAASYRIAVTPINFSPTALLYAVPKGRNGDLVAGIDAAMGRMLEEKTSVYSRSYRRWITDAEAPGIPQWLRLGLLVALGVGLFLGVWTVVLRREVGRKTKSLNAEIRTRLEAEAELKRLVDEKSVLLRELYHRTKNNMQIIASLIDLKAAYYPQNKEVQDAATSTLSRIDAIALVQQMLYTEHNLSEISLADYLKDLVASIVASYPSMASRIGIRVEVAKGSALLDVAIPMGMLINELLSNSLKFAFRGRSEGHVALVVQNGADGSYRLEYSDDGQGLPEGLDPEAPLSLGLILIHEIAQKQLRGTIGFTRSPGFACRIDIPKTGYGARV